MRKRFFCTAAMLASVLVSCEKGKHDVEESVKETVSLEVKLVSEDTKASGEGGNEEKAISNYQVLLFDMTNRMLEAYDSPEASLTSISMECTTGPKEVVVLANAPDVSGIVSYDTFLKTKSRLADNALGKLVMEGHASPNLTASGGSVVVDIRRIVSKVILSGITVDFEQDAYDKMDFVIKKAYLTNVAGDKSYLSETADPTVWYNKNVRTSVSAIDPLVYEDLGSVNIKETKKYTNKHHFYCYPNPFTTDTFSTDPWTERPTRLVLETTLGNVPYYYPISLPELKQNTKYYVSLHIIRPGSTSPEQDMDKYAVSFNVTIEEWKGPVNVSDTI